jgi:hypothetical protein
MTVEMILISQKVLYNKTHQLVHDIFDDNTVSKIILLIEVVNFGIELQ